LGKDGDVTETTYWVLGGFAGAVAVAAVYKGDVVVAVAAVFVACILFFSAYRKPKQ
jgi:hypothetical protein